MSEPTSTSLATATAFATATAATTLLPGMDGNALVGAMAGGALFVTSAHDLPLIRRVLYLLISTGAGYVAAPDVLQHLPLHSAGVAAFLAGACAVTVTTQIIERVKALDLSILLKRGG